MVAFIISQTKIRCREGSTGREPGVCTHQQRSNLSPGFHRYPIYQEGLRSHEQRIPRCPQAAGIPQINKKAHQQINLADALFYFTFSFGLRKYVFFISDWEWDNFLSHKKKRLRIRNKQNVASCCDLHNHPKNSFGCKGKFRKRWFKKFFIQ